MVNCPLVSAEGSTWNLLAAPENNSMALLSRILHWTSLQGVLGSGERSKSLVGLASKPVSIRNHCSNRRLFTWKELVPFLRDSFRQRSASSCAPCIETRYIYIYRFEGHCQSIICSIAAYRLSRSRYGRICAGSMSFCLRRPVGNMRDGLTSHSHPLCCPRSMDFAQILMRNS